MRYMRFLFIHANGETNWGDWTTLNLASSSAEAKVLEKWSLGLFVAIQLSADGEEPAYTYTQAGAKTLRRYSHTNFRTDTVLLP